MAAAPANRHSTLHSDSMVRRKTRPFRYIRSSSRQVLASYIDSSYERPADNTSASRADTISDVRFSSWRVRCPNYMRSLCLRCRRRFDCDRAPITDGIRSTLSAFGSLDFRFETDYRERKCATHTLLALCWFPGPLPSVLLPSVL